MNDKMNEYSFAATWYRDKNPSKCKQINVKKYSL